MPQHKRTLWGVGAYGASSWFSSAGMHTYRNLKGSGNDLVHQTSPKKTNAGYFRSMGWPNSKIRAGLILKNPAVEAPLSLRWAIDWRVLGKQARVSVQETKGMLFRIDAFALDANVLPALVLGLPKGQVTLVGGLDGALTATRVPCQFARQGRGGSSPIFLWVYKYI